MFIGRISYSQRHVEASCCLLSKEHYVGKHADPLESNNNKKEIIYFIVWQLTKWTQSSKKI